MWITSVSSRLMNVSAGKYIVFATVLCLFIDIAFTITELTFGMQRITPSVELTSDYSVVLEIISAAIIVPLLETSLFQMLPIRILHKRAYSPCCSILLSSIFFGILHYYSLMFILYSMIIGIVLAYTYWVFEYVRSESGFWVTAGLHATFNALLIVVSIIAPL